MVRVLVVEDDEVLAERLQFGLARAGYEATRVGDGGEALRLARRGEFDLLILDLMLPGMDGWAVCRALRDRRDPVPILMLTALDSVDERIRGLDCGADDYLGKPFDFGELLARARALVRREQTQRSRVVRLADLELDAGARVVRRAGEVVHLTPREYDLLADLVANEGRTVSRVRILEVVWRDDESLSDTISFHVSSLRRKIDGGRTVPLIHTVHGVGYVLRRPPDSGS